jgi:type IV pilus assembly protein PilY1
MHAFDMDSGQEVWGFVPPALMPRLYTRFPNVPQRGVDGSPVVKEVVFQRSGTALGDDASWHTVLLFGLGRGATTDSGIGSAYIAMDVTDPYNPKLLWQFTDPELGDTFGSPTIGTLFYRLPSTGENVERAVAFLPGGGSDLVAGCTTPRPVSGARGWTGWSGGRGARRPTVRCWRNTVSTATANRGQWLYVVDLATGQLIRKIGAGSRGTTATVTPITGTPALYNGVSGAVTSRVYVGDADGTIWRADVSSRDQNEWYMAEAWDLFWDATAPGAVQPVYERPAVTVDRDGRLHLVAGSGDPDFLEGMDANRIASFSERASTDPTSGAVTALTLEANWELGVGGRVADRDLYLGERLTGPLTIHNNSLYFGTFVPRTSADPCEVGFARLWGVDMSATDSAAGAYAPKARLDLDGNPATTGDIVRVTTDLNNNTLADDSNSVLYGVTVERQPDCNVNSSVTDPLTGLSRPYVSSTSGGGYRLVVQTGAGSTGIGSVRSYRFANLPAPRYPTRVDAWATVFE